MLRTSLLIAVMSLVPLVADAQTSVVEGRMTVPADQRGEQIRVQVSVSFYVPGPTGESDAAFRAQERARRTVYELAGRECALLREVIASECRLESINVNINRHAGQQPEGFQAGGNFGYRITLK
jgi:hypothetical protein